MAQLLNKKIHNPISLLIISLLFSPLAGILMTGVDYKKFGRKNWLLTAMAPLLITLIVAVIDVSIITTIDLPQVCYPVTLSFTYYLYQKRLKEEESVFKFRSIMESLTIGVLSLILTMPLLAMSYS